MIAFIDTHRDQFGVELICRTLRAAIVGFLTSRGYRAAKARPRSARAIRDELLNKARGGGWVDPNGSAYATAMSLIILQLPNNYLPILQK